MTFYLFLKNSNTLFKQLSSGIRSQIYNRFVNPLTKWIVNKELLSTLKASAVVLGPL